MQITIRNDGARPSPPLTIKDAAPDVLGGPVRVAFGSLRPRAEQTVNVQKTFGMRGRHTIGPLRGRLTDPFGLAERFTELAPAAQVLAYPRIDVLRESAPEARGESGRAPLHRLAPSGDEFYAVREWQEGDDLRMIHWRSTARLGELMIRQDEVRPLPRATILVDSRALVHSAGGPESSLEWAISGAASIIWELATQGYALRLALADGGPGVARGGREARDPLLTALAVAKPSAARSLIPALRRTMARPGAGGALIALLPPPDTESVAALARMRGVYTWCGAVLVDTSSFEGAPVAGRAAFDRRLADGDSLLTRAGWRVGIAGATDSFGALWKSLLAPYRSNLPSSRL